MPLFVYTLFGLKFILFHSLTTYKMRNYLLALIFFFSLTGSQVWGQWEKISPQLIDGTIDKKTLLQFGNTTACLVSGAEGYLVYYSTNKGKNWKKI
jgi:hypothetical protein